MSPVCTSLRPAPSITHPPQRVLFVSRRVRLLQCCTGTSVKRNAPSVWDCHQSYSATRSMPFSENHSLSPSGTRNSGRRALGELRIREHIHASELEEDAGVPDPGHRRTVFLA